MTKFDAAQRAWRPIVQQGPNQTLPSNLEFQRNAWKDHANNAIPRSPWTYPDWHELRLAIAIGEVALVNTIHRSDHQVTDHVVGDLVAQLAERHDLWATGGGSSAYCPPAWFIVQQTKNVDLFICVACGHSQPVTAASHKAIERCAVCSFDTGAGEAGVTPDKFLQALGVACSDLLTCSPGKSSL